MKLLASIVALAALSIWLMDFNYSNSEYGQFMDRCITKEHNDPKAPLTRQQAFTFCYYQFDFK